jgi:hypothetical protein
MRKLKFIKFDGVHPYQYLAEKKDQNRAMLDGMTRRQYHDWLIGQRINYSDYYPYNLSLHGWEAEEFVVNDPLYIEKTAEELFGSRKNYFKLKESIKNRFRPSDLRWHKFVVKSYINKVRPDVIFVREGNPFPSSFWGEFSKQALLVNRIAMNFPLMWNPGYFDLIFTSIEHYKTVFEINGIPSYLFYDGFDKRILQDIAGEEKIYDVSLVGGAGNNIFEKKTGLMEFLAGRSRFNWWGWGNQKLDKASPLHKAWRGTASGIDMYRIYKQSKIVLNDYGNIAKGIAVNQRIYEVMGVGSLLLTRHADNLDRSFPPGVFVTFRDEADCLDKINYYLENEKEREAIAAAGQAYALEHFAYDKLMGKLDPVLREHWEKKFGKH